MNLVPDGLRDQVGQLAQQAFISGFGQLLVVAGVAGLLAAITVGIYLRRSKPA
ncbi:hypothetical protein D3C80_2230490 [compost metagenome]